MCIRDRIWALGALDYMPITIYDQLQTREKSILVNDGQRILNYKQDYNLLTFEDEMCIRDRDLCDGFQVGTLDKRRAKDEAKATTDFCSILFCYCLVIFSSLLDSWS